MEIVTHNAVLEQLDSEPELTDNEIELLLTQAEDRLRQQQQLAFTKSSGFAPSLPRSAKLDVSTLAKPYVQTGDDIARADPRRLVDDKQRQLANGIRKVEDPVTTKQKVLEVCSHNSLQFFSCL